MKEVDTESHTNTTLTRKGLRLAVQELFVGRMSVWRCPILRFRHRIKAQVAWSPKTEVDSVMKRLNRTKQQSPVNTVSYAIYLLMRWGNKAQAHMPSTMYGSTSPVRTPSCSRRMILKECLALRRSAFHKMTTKVSSPQMMFSLNVIYLQSRAKSCIFSVRI